MYPESRPTVVGLYTSAGWITGTYWVPRLHTMFDFLNHGGEFLRLSDATLPGTATPIPFFAVHRDAVAAVLPMNDEVRLITQLSTVPLESHDVSCLLDLGVIQGKLELIPGVRVSDSLLHGKTFIPLRNANVILRGDSIPELSKRVELLFVNTARLVGVSDVEAQREFEPHREFAGTARK